MNTVDKNKLFSIKPEQMKQLKSNSQDLRNMFDNITVRYVAENLQVYQIDDDSAVVRNFMGKHDFDVLGIEEDGIICGYVKQSNLETGRCKDHLCRFSPSELISESTPLICLLSILRESPRVFVLDRNRVSGIVTRGDLQKAPVRMFLFGLINLLEMQMLRLIRICYIQDSWHKLISDDRLGKAGKLLEEREKRNEAIDLTDCLQFCDKSEIILKTPEILEQIWSQSKTSGNKFLKAAGKLRDKLAHAQDIVSGSSWPELIILVGKVEAVLIKCEEIENL